jgi:glutaredoxin-related protein|tara:strand:- start:105 stop:473 length:369 start_codon:yes stop_codon:yes gene_type:complete
MRKMLSSTAIHASIKDQVEGYHIDIVDEVKAAVSVNRVVVVGMRYDDAVYGARKALKKAGTEFTYLEYGGYASQWRWRLALKMWTGWPTFPMIFVDQTLVGGSKDLQRLLNDGKLAVDKVNA